MHPERPFVKNEYSVYYVPMPKVTDEHRESRREQILIAAWKCFARNGFHSTSMADVIAEADLSAGAVYLYFRSKDEIIVAVATQVFGGIQGRLADMLAARTAAEPGRDRRVPGPTAGAARRGAHRPTCSRCCSPCGARRPGTRRSPTSPSGSSAGLRSQLAAAVERWADATGNELPMPATDMAPIIMSLVQGMVVQRALSPALATDSYRTSVEKLFIAAGLGPSAPRPVRGQKPQRRLRVVRSE